MSMRKKRAKQARLMKVPEELKFFDTAVSFTPDSTLEVPATGQWALIPQGDTQSTRDGRLARIKSIYFRGELSGPSTAVNLSAFYMWVVQDKQANGAAAAASDVFTGSLATTCLRNLNNFKRFKILHKEEVSPNKAGAMPVVAAQTNFLIWPFEFFLNCNILMDWNSTAGAITEITQNNIFIVAGVSGSGVDDQYSVAGNARLRFVG